MKTRLYVAGVMAGFAVLAVVLIAVFFAGRNDPSPPSLVKDPKPEIPGQILFLDRDECFHRAAASGESTERLACIPEYPGARLYWLDDATAGFVRLDNGDARLYEIDLVTGAISPSGTPVELPDDNGPPGYAGGEYAPDGAYASFTEDGELFVLEGGRRTKIAEFDVPRYNQPRVVLWSPDSQWILAQHYLRDSGGPELWIISRDGQTKGTLTDESNAGPGGAAVWRIEGLGSWPLPPD